MRVFTAAPFCFTCVAISVAGSRIAAALELPLHLDCPGVILAGAMGGYVPGVVVGFLANVATSVFDSSSLQGGLPLDKAFAIIDESISLSPHPRRRYNRFTVNCSYKRRKYPMAAQHMAPTQQRRKKKTHVVPVIACLIVLAALGVGGFFAWRYFSSFRVTVNGQMTTVQNGDTVEKLLDEGLVSPKPGNLLAVDGSLIAEGEGERATVTINSNAVSITTPLTANAEVQIDDGGDSTEEYTTNEEAIPFETDEGDRSFAAYWNGSIHLLSDGKDGVRVTKTGNVSGITVEDSVTQPVNAGYRIYTANPTSRVIALTFDDGPWPETTSQILDILEQYNAKATFFTIGNQVADYSDQVKRASDMGCQVCTHTWDHASGSGGGVDLTRMSTDEQIEEVQKGYAAIADVLGEEPAHIMRSPGGNFYGDLISTLWPYVDVEIGWDVDTEDWSRPGVEAIQSAILSVQPGQVVLMHDGGGDRSQTVEALRNAMPALVDQGYTFVTINELLTY